MKLKELEKRLKTLEEFEVEARLRLETRGY